MVVVVLVVVLVGSRSSSSGYCDIVADWNMVWSKLCEPSPLPADQAAPAVGSQAVKGFGCALIRAHVSIFVRDS